MRGEEVVVRSLVREWLIIEEASEEGAKAGLAAASELSGIESLIAKLDSALEKIDDKIESKNESVTAILLGLGLSLPTLVNWISKGLSAAVRGYASLASKFSDSDQSNKLAWAETIEAAGKSFYKKGHHLIEEGYSKIVEILFLLLCEMGDPGGMAGYRAYAQSSKGQEEFLKIAKTIDLAVTCILAVYSVKGAIAAIETAHAGLAATEGVLSAVKTAHIGTAVSEAVAEISRALARALAEAGLATALASELVEKASAFFKTIESTVMKGVNETKKAAQAAGLAVALAAGSVSDEVPVSKYGTEQRDG